MALKIKVYKIPNPEYKGKEPDAEETFDTAVDALAEAIGNEFEGNWKITQIAGGDAVLVVIFEK